MTPMRPQTRRTAARSWEIDLLINPCETILVSEAGLTHRRNVNNHLHLPPFSCKRFTDIVKGKLQLIDPGVTPV